VGIFDELIEVMPNLLDAFEVGWIAALAPFDDKAFTALGGEVSRKIIGRDTSKVSLVRQPLIFRFREAEYHLAATPLGCVFFWSWHVMSPVKKSLAPARSVERAIST
jgi:hypothetical protein